MGSRIPHVDDPLAEGPLDLQRVDRCTKADADEHHGEQVCAEPIAECLTELLDKPKRRGRIFILSR